MSERRRRQKPRETRTDQPRQAVALAWLLVGLGLVMGLITVAPTTALEKPVSLVVIYITVTLCLDLFVGASKRVALQRIAPAAVLAMLVTPGIPIAVALVADLLGTEAVAGRSRTNWYLIAQAGKALLPAGLTACFLLSRGEASLDNSLFASEIFLLVSLFLRTTEPPFRSDLFLVVSYPAIALMLRSLAELHLAYMLLAVPLLFLLTTVDTEMLLRYFQLQKRMDHTQVEITQTRKAQRQSEIESRRKGILLNRRELQLSLLNGLGREMDAAQAREDLGRFLLNESVRLTDAHAALILFTDEPAGRVVKIIGQTEPRYWGIKEGDRIPDSVANSISPKAPWNAPLWRDKRAFLTCEIGNQGWLFLGSTEVNAFPTFLEEFFLAVGRHAGSAVLALRRLTEVRLIAQREAQEREKVATEKEKVAEQNRNLRLLIQNFEGLTEGALTSDIELLRRGTQAIKRITGADQVILQAKGVEDCPRDHTGLLVEGRRWPSYIFLKGTSNSGNLLCLSAEVDAFSSGQVEWCTLLKDFLDKTMENGSLHRRVQASYAKLERTQKEVVLSSQWAAAGRLAANAAHELNTPLGAIRLAAEQAAFFLPAESAPAPAVQGLQSILRSIDRCREVTDRLLITSRPVDRTETPTKPEKQSLLPILKDAIESVRPYLRASNIQLADHRLIQDFMVSVVLQDLYWAVVNILKNGVDALNDGERADKRLAVAAAQKGSRVEIRIADNGPGLPSDLEKKVFDPFFTTKKLGQGNGLGLSLSRTNLRRWGGEIEFEPTPGGGATFILTIPLAANGDSRN